MFKTLIKKKFFYYERIKSGTRYLKTFKKIWANKECSVIFELTCKNKNKIAKITKIVVWWRQSKTDRADILGQRCVIQALKRWKSPWKGQNGNDDMLPFSLWLLTLSLWLLTHLIVENSSSSPLSALKERNEFILILFSLRWNMFRFS